MTTNPVNVLVLTSPISLVEIVPPKGFIQCRRERVAFDDIRQRVEILGMPLNTLYTLSISEKQCS